MNISDIINGLIKSAEADLINGVEKGIGYFRQTEEILVWAAGQFKQPDFMQNAVFCVVQCGQVVEQWLEDAYGVGRTATSTLLPEVVTYFEQLAIGQAVSVDPFKPSRIKAQMLASKWAKAAGVK